MNYLAHLFLAQPNPDSSFGNLLGDFRKGVEIDSYSDAVKQGLENHYAVDKYTDDHPAVQQAKLQISPQRRRFAGIILDVAFDYFLIKHWHLFCDTSFDAFRVERYAFLETSLPIMPERMRYVVGRIVAQDWLGSYATIDGVGHALDNISRRIRFKNDFTGSIEDLTTHYALLEDAFLKFFPQLCVHIEQNGPESPLYNGQ